MPFLKNNCRWFLSSLIKFVYKQANTCLVTLYMMPVTKKSNIETTENDLKIEQITKSNNANKQV